MLEHKLRWLLIELVSSASSKYISCDGDTDEVPLVVTAESGVERETGIGNMAGLSLGDVFLIRSMA